MKYTLSLLQRILLKDAPAWCTTYKEAANQMIHREINGAAFSTLASMGVGHGPFIHI